MTPSGDTRAMFIRLESFARDRQTNSNSSKFGALQMNTLEYFDVHDVMVAMATELKFRYKTEDSCP